MIGRYGMSTTSCRIPLGVFYGHSIILKQSDTTPAQHKEKLQVTQTLLHYSRVYSNSVEDVRL